MQLRTLDADLLDCLLDLQLQFLLPQNCLLLLAVYLGPQLRSLHLGLHARVISLRNRHVSLRKGPFLFGRSYADCSAGRIPQQISELRKSVTRYSIILERKRPEMGIHGKCWKNGLRAHLPNIVPPEIDHLQAATIDSDQFSDKLGVLVGQLVVLQVHQLQKSQISHQIHQGRQSRRWWAHVVPLGLQGHQSGTVH